MTARVEVSVVIAAFNAEATLGEQLAALSRQRVSFPFEVLVCDNGSTDGTVAVAERWRVEGLPVRVLDASARRGPGAARNVGAAQARGASLVFCDADDVVADDWLFEMHTALQTHEFVAGTCRKPYLHIAPGEPAEFYEYSLYRAPFFPQLPAAGAGNMGVRTEVFRSVGGFDDIFRTAEDDDLCWRIQLAGHRLVAHPAAVLTVRHRSSLRATFAQAYSHRAGENVLRHKYARVIESFRGLEPAQFAFDGVSNDQAPADEAPSPAPSAPSLIRRAFRKLFRVRRLSDLRLSDLSTVTYQLGEVFGRRFVWTDRSQPQLDPPANPAELLGRA